MHPDAAFTTSCHPAVLRGREYTRRGAALGIVGLLALTALGCSRQAAASTGAAPAPGTAAPSSAERTAVLEVPLLSSWEADECCLIPPERLLPALLSGVDGVSGVEVDRPRGWVRVQYHPAQVTPERLARLLAEEGFPARVAAVE